MTRHKFIKGIEHVPCTAKKHKSKNCSGWVRAGSCRPLWCHECRSEYLKNYRLQNRDKFKQKHHGYMKPEIIEKQLNETEYFSGIFSGGLNEFQLNALRTGNVEALLAAPVRPNPYDN